MPGYCYKRTYAHITVRRITGDGNVYTRVPARACPGRRTARRFTNTPIDSIDIRVVFNGLNYVSIRNLIRFRTGTRVAVSISKSHRRRNVTVTRHFLDDRQKTRTQAELEFERILRGFASPWRLKGPVCHCMLIHNGFLSLFIVNLNN